MKITTLLTARLLLISALSLSVVGCGARSIAEALAQALLGRSESSEGPCGARPCENPPASGACGTVACVDPPAGGQGACGDRPCVDPRR